MVAAERGRGTSDEAETVSVSNCWREAWSWSGEGEGEGEGIDMSS